MTDVKNKVKNASTTAKSKYEESGVEEKVKTVSEKAKVKIKEAKLDEKFNNVSTKAKEKFEEYEVKEKSIAFKNKAIAKIKLKIKEIKEDENLKQTIKTKLSKENIKHSFNKCFSNKKRVKIIASIIAVLVVLCIIFKEDKPREIMLNNEKTTYIFNDDKIYGTAIDIRNNGTMKIEKDKIVFDGVPLKVKSIEKTDSYYHEKLQKNFDDLSYVIVTQNFLLGGDIVLLLEEEDFDVNDEELTGYNIYSVHSNQRKLYSDKPGAKVIFTQYAEEK